MLQRPWEKDCFFQSSLFLFLLLCFAIPSLRFPSQICTQTNNCGCFRTDALCCHITTPAGLLKVYCHCTLHRTDTRTVQSAHVILELETVHLSPPYPRRSHFLKDMVVGGFPFICVTIEKPRQSHSFSFPTLVFLK